jgi:hypothetical protein
VQFTCRSVGCRGVRVPTCSSVRAIGCCDSPGCQRMLLSTRLQAGATVAAGMHTPWRCRVRDFGGVSVPSVQFASTRVFSGDGQYRPVRIGESEERRAMAGVHVKCNGALVATVQY